MLRLLAFVLVLSATDAMAAKRIDVSNKSCDAIKQIMTQERAPVLLVFESKRIAGLDRYGLYVSDSRFCRAPQVASTRRISSSTGACSLYACVDSGRGGGR
jgi:hypothetical protein